jgi:ubiquinone/menaquinone biosynthesis C-methylase UbiE
MGYFNIEAKRYSRLYSITSPYHSFYVHYRQKQALSFFSGHRVLDVGCGPGYLLEELLRYNVSLTGCDLSSEMIELAKNRLHGVKLCQADAASLPFPDKSFDFVFSLGVLPYLKEPLKGMKEIYRVLSPKGKACITYPYKKTPLAFFRENPSGIWIRKNILKLAHYQVKYDRKEFIQHVEQLGFVPVSEKQIFLSEFMLVITKK